MSGRLHPQDLRAIVAAQLAAGLHASPFHDHTLAGMGWHIPQAVDEADLLLDQLERTARPEPKTDALACGHGSWSIQENGDMGCLLCGTEWVRRPEFLPDPGAIRAHAYRCGFEDGLSGKVTKPVPETDKDAALESYREWEAGILEAVKAAGWTIFDGPIQDWIRSDHLRAKAEGAREERERIIARFVENTKRNTFEDGEAFLTRWSAVNGRETLHNEAGIRAALEPKP